MLNEQQLWLMIIGLGLLSAGVLYVYVRIIMWLLRKAYRYITRE